MSLEQKEIDSVVFTTVFDSFTAIMKSVLNIEQMKKLLYRLEQWVEYEEKRMNEK